MTEGDFNFLLLLEIAVLVKKQNRNKNCILEAKRTQWSRVTIWENISYTFSNNVHLQEKNNSVNQLYRRKKLFIYFFWRAISILFFNKSGRWAIILDAAIQYPTNGFVHFYASAFNYASCWVAACVLLMCPANVFPSRYMCRSLSYALKHRRFNQGRRRYIVSDCCLLAKLVPPWLFHFTPHSALQRLCTKPLQCLEFPMPYLPYSRHHFLAYIWWEMDGRFAGVLEEPYFYCCFKKKKSLAHLVFL